jgi:hypothetical protein
VTDSSITPVHFIAIRHCLCDCYVYLLRLLGVGGRFIQGTSTSTELHSVSALLGGPRWLSWYSDSLRAVWSKDRILVGARFSAPVQTGPGAHPAYYTKGPASFPEMKWPGHGIDHPLQSSAKVKESVELYVCSTSGPLWPVLG